MKTATLLLSAIVLSLLFSAGACKKDTDDMHSCPPNRDNRADKRLEPFLFATNSYWVYQETSTQTIDSQVVIYSLYASPPTISYCTYYTDVRESRVVSYGNQLDTFTYQTQNLPLKTLTLGGGNVLLSLNLNLGDTDEFGTQFINQYSSMVIGGVNYTNVLAFHIPARQNAPMWFQYESDLYYAPGVGLVRKVEYNTPNGTQTWDLLRYRAIPIED